MNGCTTLSKPFSHSPLVFHLCVLSSHFRFRFFFSILLPLHSTSWTSWTSWTYRERKGSFFHQKRRLSSQVSLEQRTFDFNPITSGQHQGHQHQANQHIANVPAINEMGTSFSDSTGIINPLPPSSPSVSSRRRLPKLPTAGSTSTVPQPEILIEFFLDVDRQELMVTIVSARGFTPPSTSYTFVMAQVLPAVRE